jgi:hypothetical protein
MYIQQYVRVKRQRTTLFVLCDPDEPIASLLAKCAKMQQKDVDDIRLLKGDVPLADATQTAAAAGIANDDVLLLVFREAGDKFESPTVESYPDGGTEDSDDGEDDNVTVGVDAAAH